MNWVNASRWVLDLGWLLFLLVLFRHFWHDRMVLVRSKSWLKTKGRIIRCDWVEEGHNIWPTIEYSYQVHEQDLVGSYLFLDTSHNNPNSKYSRRMAYNVALAFKESTDIDVYYNPNHPEQSALDITMPWKLTIILSLIGSVILIHLGIMLYRLMA